MAIKTLKTNLQSYGQTLKMCEFLIKGDSYFKGKNVDTTKINKEISIKSYCYNDDCKTNGERINALTVYIYMKFKNSIRATDYNTYDECLLMWLSDKLLKIRNESKEKKVKPPYIDTITLKDAYEKYLKNHKVILDYWTFFDIIKGLKEANLRYMSEFYLLLNRICKTIVDHKDNGAESNNLSKYSKNCLNQYRSLYLSISECDSYLRLLNKLKGIYDDFRSYAITKNSSNNNLATNLKKLTKPNGEEMDAVRYFKPYKIPKKKCYSQKKKPTTPKDSKPNPGPAPQSSEPQQTQTPTPLPGPGPPQAQKKDSSSLPQPPNPPTDNNQKTSPPSASDPALGNNQEDLDKSSKDPSSEQEDLENNKKLLKILIDGQITFEMYRSPFHNVYTEIKKRVNESISSAIEKAHTNYIYISNKINDAIKQLSEQLQKVSTPAKETKDPHDHKKLEHKSPSSSSTDPQTQNSHQTNPSTNISLNGQKDVFTHSNNLMTNSVPDAGIKESTPKVILLGNIFKRGVPTYVKAIVILIPIILLIVYKYLSSGWRKEMKRKKNMKRVINSIVGKKQIQIIIKSSNQKKNTKKSINSVYWEKSPSLNIYKIMQADPVPFINLFFLLIFFVYKRKENSLE
ncbi:CIR protein PIR protein [Plasmodium vinckei vinckei]|uniref:CIR protein PIR protein n=1 Tax=Plasmodium vinckei vinckei TaxID=54757 RepID=A0A449BVT8_PLAVN|nr:CIR protein PIR protein [Plasmodium vinckei vinckei]VEV57600.1 CIR protein PIR protein [Plasmodium vinckei vinckei]